MQHTKRITDTIRLYQILILVSITCGFISNDTPSKILKGHEWSVTTLDINKTGDLLLSGAWDNKMILWDLSTNEMIYKFDNHSNMIWDVSFSNDDKYVASASWDASINVWDIKSKELIYKFKHEPKYKKIQTEPFYQEHFSPNMINSIDFSPDNRLLASGSSDGIIRIWNLKTGELKETINIHDSVSVKRILFDKSGTKLISSSDKIKVYNLELKQIEIILDGHNGTDICALDLDKTGKYLISGDIAIRNPLIILWDIETGGKIRVFKGHDAIIRDISFSNNNKYMASVGEDNLIKLWSIENNDAIATFTDNDKKELNAVCFTHDDKMIIYGSQDKTIKFRDINKYTDLQ